MSFIDKLKGVPSDEFLAQAGHFLFAVSAVALPGWVWGWWGAAIGTFLILAYASVKEIFWDPKMEKDNAFWPEGAKDLAFFVLGVAFAWGIRLFL